MNSSCLVITVAALFSAEPRVDEVISPGLRVQITSHNEHLTPEELLRLLRLELGISAPAGRELRISLDEREAYLTLRGACPEAELHDVLPIRAGLAAASSRIVALAAAELVSRELPRCPLIPEPSELETPAAPAPSWLPTVQPFIGARVWFAHPTLTLNAGVEFAASTTERNWWGELGLFLQGTRVTRTVGRVDVWAPTLSLGVRHEWGDRWRLALGLRTEVSWALVNGVSKQAGVEGQKESGLLLGSSAVVGLRRYLAGAAWLTAELAAGYDYRGLDVHIAERSAFLLGGFWLDVRLGVSFDLLPSP